MGGLHFPSTDAVRSPRDIVLFNRMRTEVMGTIFTSCFWKEWKYGSLVSLSLSAGWVIGVMASAEAATLELELKAVAVKITLPVLGHLPTWERNIFLPWLSHCIWSCPYWSTFSWLTQNSIIMAFETKVLFYTVYLWVLNTNFLRVRTIIKLRQLY